MVPFLIAGAVMLIDHTARQASKSSAQPKLLKQPKPESLQVSTEQYLAEDLSDSVFMPFGSNEPIIIEIDQQYQANFDKALDIIERCGLWQDFESRVSKISQNDTHPGYTKDGHYALNHRQFDGSYQFIRQRCPIFIKTRVLDETPENLAFMLLHEYAHLRLADEGKATVDLAEEPKCDKLAHDALTKNGYKYTMKSAY